MSTPDVSKTNSTPTPPPRPKGLGAAPAPAHAHKASRDQFTRTKATPQNKPDEHEVMQAPEKAPGWVKRLWDLTFGNVENKLFQIKLNLLQFKDVVIGLIQTLESGPLQPLFNVVENVGGWISGLLTGARAAARDTAAGSSKLGRAIAVLGSAFKPLKAVGAVVAKGLERTAPIFGWLTAFQDTWRAIGFQTDKDAPLKEKVMRWATAGLSIVGATASSIAAWGAVGAAIAAPTGIGGATLGTIAIVAFGLSILTGWAANRMMADRAKDEGLSIAEIKHHVPARLKTSIRAIPETQKDELA